MAIFSDVGCLWVGRREEEKSVWLGEEEERLRVKIVFLLTAEL